MTKQIVFIVEDDPDISQLLQHHLKAVGFATHIFSDGASVISEVERVRPQLFIIDVMLPSRSGLDLCSTIRQSALLEYTPVIFVTAKSSEADRILGLEVGADDYISKPFSPRELVARVKAVLRRHDLPATTPLFRIGEIELDPSAMTLTVRGRPCYITTTEFRMLEHFVRHTGRTFTRNQLLDFVWRDGGYVSLRSVDVYVRRVREKIERTPEYPRYLKTVRGIGYRFDSTKNV